MSLMPQKRGKTGRYESGTENKKLKSFRLSPGLHNQLQALPNSSKFIETSVVNAIARFQPPTNDHWDYYNEWEALQSLILIVGNGIENISQYQNKCKQGDGEITILREKIKEWLNSTP